MLEKGFTVPLLLQPALPQAFSWFPLPAGWFVLAGGLLIAILLAALFRIARFRRNVWRRQAYSALRQTTYVDDWLALIKRILLMHHPREQISQDLTPQQLLRHVPLDDDLRCALSAKYCQPDNQLDERQSLRLKSQLRRWLEGLPYV